MGNQEHMIPPAFLIPI